MEHKNKSMIRTKYLLLMPKDTMQAEVTLTRSIAELCDITSSLRIMILYLGYVSYREVALVPLKHTTSEKLKSTFKISETFSQSQLSKM